MLNATIIAFLAVLLAAFAFVTGMYSVAHLLERGWSLGASHALWTI